MMKRVYFASKLKHRAKWRALKDMRVHAHARWLRHNEIGTPDTPEFASRFWVEDHEDVAAADYVIVYAEQGEHLRGALVEAGIAIALDVPVLVIGDHPDFGTWQHHPSVTRCATLDDAFNLIGGSL